MDQTTDTRGALTVRDVMTSRPDVAAPEDAVGDAIAEMLYDGTRHLPVVDSGGKVVGMLSDRDIRRVVGNPVDAFASEDPPERIRGRTVADIMTKDPVCCVATDPLTAVVATFVKERFGAMPVVDAEGRLVGIVSTIDLLRRFGQLLAER